MSKPTLNDPVDRIVSFANKPVDAAGDPVPAQGVLPRKIDQRHLDKAVTYFQSIPQTQWSFDDLICFVMWDAREKDVNDKINAINKKSQKEFADGLAHLKKMMDNAPDEGMRNHIHDHMHDFFMDKILLTVSGRRSLMSVVHDALDPDQTFLGQSLAQMVLQKDQNTPIKDHPASAWILEVLFQQHQERVLDSKAKITAFNDEQLNQDLSSAIAILSSAHASKELSELVDLVLEKTLPPPVKDKASKEQNGAEKNQNRLAWLIEMSLEDAALEVFEKNLAGLKIEPALDLFRHFLSALEHKPKKAKLSNEQTPEDIEAQKIRAEKEAQKETKRHNVAWKAFEKMVELFEKQNGKKNKPAPLSNLAANAFTAMSGSRFASVAPLYVNDQAPAPHAIRPDLTKQQTDLLASLLTLAVPLDHDPDAPYYPSNLFLFRLKDGASPAQKTQQKLSRQILATVMGKLSDDDRKNWLMMMLKKEAFHQPNAAVYHTQRIHFWPTGETLSPFLDDEMVVEVLGKILQKIKDGAMGKDTFSWCLSVIESMGVLIKNQDLAAKVCAQFVEKEVQENLSQYKKLSALLSKKELDDALDVKGPSPSSKTKKM